MELASKNTTPCLPIKVEDARSAVESALIQGEKSDLQSITATQQGALGGYCAEPAIRDLDNSKTSPSAFDAPQNTSKAEAPWWVLWCDTDYEQDELERVFGDLAISIRGSQKTEQKEALHDAWLRGERYLLICKPVMFGFGLNWQHCHKMLFVGLSFSYESFYQAVRRCHRFGQQRSVQVHIACADTEESIWTIVSRKAGDHEGMKIEMTEAMSRASMSVAEVAPYKPAKPMALPNWMIQ